MTYGSGADQSCPNQPPIARQLTAPGPISDWLRWKRRALRLGSGQAFSPANLAPYSPMALATVVPERSVAPSQPMQGFCDASSLSPGLKPRVLAHPFSPG